MVRVRQWRADRVLFGAVAASLLAAVVAFACLDGEPALAALAAGDETPRAPNERPASAATSSVLDVLGPAAIVLPEDVARATPSLDVDIEDPRIEGLVNDLRDDDIRWNASAAWSELVRLPPGRIASLEGALGSRDAQQRQFAGAILRQRCEAGRASPSAALFDVTVESMRSDVRANFVGTAAEPLRGTTLRFLVERAKDAAPALRRALASDDRQQRVFAAFALAPVARTDEAAAIVQELAPLLANNDRLGDALLASHALYRLGAASLPALRYWRPYVDDQARALIDLIEQDLVSPPRDLATMQTRGRSARISTLYHDAVIEFDLRRSLLPRL